MSERKVLNKYYPPDFDPSKIPRMKLARNRQYTVRLMAPFNMKCQACGEYIYKGKKFNARKEDVEGDSYLGIRIYRFYIKCTRCLQEISFKTDPKNTDYEIEAGATRNFMALKLAEEQAKREEDEEKEEEANNPMKLLEKRTQQSKQELDRLESLEELKDLNRRQQIINYDQMIEKYDTTAARLRTEKEQEELDEKMVKEIFNKKKRVIGEVLEEEIVEEIDDEPVEPPRKIQTVSCNKPSSSIDEKRKNFFGIKIKHVNKSTDSTKNGKVNESKSGTSDVSTNPETPQESKSGTNDLKTVNTNVSEKPNGLSLLGAYSGSSDEDN